jgi:hypothetical protein
MTCKGEKVTRAFKVVAPRDTFFLDKTEVEAGGDISVVKTKQSGCGEIATSPGFTAPVEIKYEAGNTRIGNGKAVGTAGAYQVEMICEGKPVHQQFVVKAKAPTTITEKPQAKAPIVKPKGAPQTGGGGTAR